MDRRRQQDDPGRRPDPGRRRSRDDQDRAANRHLNRRLGAALARLQAEVALTRILERFPHLEPAGAPTWRTSIVLRRPQAPTRRHPTVRPAGILLGESEEGVIDPIGVFHTGGMHSM